MKKCLRAGWVHSLIIVLTFGMLVYVASGEAAFLRPDPGYNTMLGVKQANMEGNPNHEVYPEVTSLANRRGVISQANEPIVVDGELSESVWSEVYGLAHFQTAFHNQPPSSDTTVKTLYDQNHLYISVQGDSDGGSPAEAERLFILLSTNNTNSKFYQIPLIVTHGPIPIGIRYKNFTNGDIRDNNQEIIDLIANKAVSPVITKQSDGSWTAEMAIPFDALGVTSVQSGDKWHMNVLRYFGPDSPRLLNSWIPIRVSEVIDGDYNGRENRRAILSAYVSNEGRLGSLFFNQIPEMPGTGKPAVEWTPENARLLYRHYTEKTLELDAADLSGDSTVQLIWTSPYGEKTVIDQATIAEAGGKRLLSFTHPAPKENGWYQLQIRIAEPGESVIKDLHLSFDRYSLIEAGDQLYPTQQAEGTPRAITAQPASAEVANLLALVPERVGLNFIWVPHKPELSERSVNYSWSPANPWQIVSTDSEKIAYPNPLYPEDNHLTVMNAKGEAVDYPYYEDSQGRRYFLSAHLWYLQRDYLIKRTKELSTIDPLGAARLLYRFAQVYPGWVPVNDIDGGAQYPISTANGPPYNYYGGMWSRWSQTELNALAPLADAYAEIKKTNALQLLSLEVGDDVDRTIVNDMFLPSVEFYHTFPVIKSNVEYFNWIGLMSLARALNEPKYMHEAVEQMAQYVSSQYMLDGFWKEVSIGYHKDSVMGIQKAVALAAGWTDPEHYESPRSGERYVQLNPGEYVPQIDEMANIRNILAYPNRGFFPVNDTWAFEKATVSLSMPSLLKPAAGIAKLTRGTGLSQNQLYLKFSPYNGHDHKDP
ncbi:MAG: Heparinase II/III-like protein, partial [Paenibacillus sp.]|nr:Heparinase II/III-like protein [Paenibacillus sp.]